MKSPTKAPRNRTITISDEDREILSSELRSDCSILEGVVKGDSFELSKKLPTKCVDLLVLDPPYNLTKTFGKESFSSRSPEKYQCWIESYLKIIMPALKPTASIYVCGDWLSSASLFPALDKYFKVRNRITWEREKGRGSKTNWKNCSEDIWYCTMGDEFKFYPERVRLRRKVLAPYKDSEGKPKDWVNKAGKKYRDTAPSNLWSDITIPFWSMPENTNHPTQKPEKLIAKLILSSSDEKDFIFDPFLGSGTTLVVAKKLKRRYLGFEKDLEYCLYALKRLKEATNNSNIQGYQEEVFWERNSCG
tara:strand:+ start:5002 stop:5916 length:915 start_codon:yes stop_codon:yes gene_type:complete